MPPFFFLFSLPQDVLSPKHEIIAFQVNQWVQAVLAETEMSNARDVFCGYYENTLAGIVLTMSAFDESFSLDTDALVDKVRLLTIEFF